MLQVDPYATLFSSSTPYSYVKNNPIGFNDPSGGKKLPKDERLEPDQEARYGGGGWYNFWDASASYSYGASHNLDWAKNLVRSNSNTGGTGGSNGDGTSGSPLLKLALIGINTTMERLSKQHPMEEQRFSDMQMGKGEHGHEN